MINTTRIDNTTDCRDEHYERCTINNTTERGNKANEVEDRVRSENAMVIKEAIDAIKCGTCARQRDEGMTGT